MNELSVLSAALRTDLASFIAKAFDQLNPGIPYRPNWHIEAIAHHLTLCFEREITRLVITVPPRHLKSIATSVAFVAWALGRDPSLRFICVSYAQELALKHSLDTRAVMESDWYRRIFPRTRIHPDRNTQLEVMTTLRGLRLATSVEGTLTGRGGNFLIIDDAHKPDEALSDVRRQRVIDWVGTTLYSRLDDKKNDVIIVIQQRLHEDDLAGYFVRQGGWTHLNLPAITEEEQRIPIGYGRVHIRRPGDLLHPERESKQTLAAIRQSVGSYNFAAQYQQRPVPQGGGIIKWDWFGTYEERPSRQHGDLVVQSWDTASKSGELNDYSVGLLFLIRAGNYHLLDVVRKRLEYPELRRLVLTNAIRHDVHAILIEDQGSGIQLIQDLRSEDCVRPIAIKPETDKITRMSVQTPAIEAGKVLLPKEAPWLADFRTELLMFPNGRHDDQVDAFSQFLAWIHRKQRLAGPRIS